MVAAHAHDIQAGQKHQLQEQHFVNGQGLDLHLKNFENDSAKNKICIVDYVRYWKRLPDNILKLKELFVLTLSGPAFSVVRQARGGLRGPDAKNRG